MTDVRVRHVSGVIGAGDKSICGYIKYIKYLKKIILKIYLIISTYFSVSMKQKHFMQRT